jgi:electron transport complex protein RnfD
MKKQLIVSSPPFLSNGETAHCLMFDVFIACLPAIAAGVYFFGWRSLLIIFVGAITAKITEAAVQIFFKVSHGQLRDLITFRPFFYNTLTNEQVTVMDGSALLTGMLLAFTLPPTVPLWIPIVGSVFGIVIGKHMFGGLGHNLFNPALAGRAFVLAAWPGFMTTWQAPVSWSASAAVDAVTTATPLAALKMQGQTTTIIDLLLGNCGGCIGETSAVALLLGAVYMLYKGTITWHIPFSYIGTVALLAQVLGQNPLFHIFAGGLMLGAFYMATDVVTSPVSMYGKIMYGCGAGLVTIIIRLFGGLPEGVCYAILVMNALAPLIDRVCTRTYKSDEVRVPLLKKVLKK